MTPAEALVGRLSAAKFKEVPMLLIFGWCWLLISAGFLVLAYREWKIARLERERDRLLAKRRRAEEHNSGSIDIVRAR